MSDKHTDGVSRREEWRVFAMWIWQYVWPVLSVFAIAGVVGVAFEEPTRQLEWTVGLTLLLALFVVKYTERKAGI